MDGFHAGLQARFLDLRYCCSRSIINQIDTLSIKIELVYMSPICNLIRTFVTLEAGSVTLAAERLFVTQPSVSYALARLRELFDDALFTRTRDGIQPTFVAEQLGTFRESLTRIEGAVQSVRHFDPATTERRFRIALTDLGEVGFLSLILERLTRDAPFAEVEVLPLQWTRSAPGW